MKTKLRIYLVLAALPVLLDWLNDSAKSVLAGQEPVLHWVIAFKLFFTMVYQAALVWKAFISNPNENPTPPRPNP